MAMVLRVVILLCGSGLGAGAASPPLDWIGVAKDSASFARVASGERFTPWGFNYDHDEAMRLIEDYWEGEWAKVDSGPPSRNDAPAARLSSATT
jgi:hypothetical protein